MSSIPPPQRNEDHPEEYRELSTRIDNYFTVEFVAIPPDFDISNYLSLREQVGIFGDSKNVNLNQVRKIADGVKHSPVFSILNNALLSIESCLYFLYVINELGLVVKSIPNPVRKSASDYKDFLTWYNQADGHYMHINGQDVKRINIVIINIFPLLTQNVIEESMNIATKMQEYQQEVDSNLKRVSCKG